MTRFRLIGIVCGLTVSVGVGWGVKNLAEAASEKATSDLLALQSWAYQLNGKEVPRQESLLPYLPYLRSRKTSIAEVATLAVLCEVKADQATVATMGFYKTVLGPLGASPTDSVEAQAHKARIEARQDEFLNQLKEPLDAAVDRGLSDAFSKEDMTGGGGGVSGKGKLIGEIIAAQSDQYKTQLAYRHMQSVLFDRCEALARSEAGPRSLAESGAKVVVEGVKKKSMMQFWLVLRNQTGRDLHHVTLSVFVAPPPPRKPDATGLVKGLGRGVSAAAGEDGAEEMATNGNRFANSVSDYEKLGALPLRVFYHIPLIPAGQEVRARFGGSPFGKSPSTFSLWCDEGTWEHANFGGLDELRAQVDAHANELKGKRDERAAQSQPRSAVRTPSSRLPNRNIENLANNSPLRSVPKPSMPGEAPAKTQKTKQAKASASAEKLDYFQELQGSWQVIEQVENGRDVSAEIRRNHWVVTRTENSFIVKAGSRFWNSGTWTVDDTKDPVQITQNIEKGQGSGKVKHIIVKLEDNTLYACIGDQTPNDFQSPRGRNLVSTKAVRVPSR